MVFPWYCAVFRLILSVGSGVIPVTTLRRSLGIGWIQGACDHQCFEPIIIKNLHHIIAIYDYSIVFI